MQYEKGSRTTVYYYYNITFNDIEYFDMSPKAKEYFHLNLLKMSRNDIEKKRLNNILRSIPKDYERSYADNDVFEKCKNINIHDKTKEIIKRKSIACIHCEEGHQYVVILKMENNFYACFIYTDSCQSESETIGTVYFTDNLNDAEKYLTTLNLASNGN